MREIYMKDQSKYSRKIPNEGEEKKEERRTETLKTTI